MRRLWMWNVIVAVVVVALVIAVGNYIYHQTTYIATNNARVSVALTTIAAPMTGTLTDWTARTGEVLQADQRIGMESGSSVTSGGTTGAGGHSVLGVSKASRTVRSGKPFTGAGQGGNQSIASAATRLAMGTRTTQRITSPSAGTVLMADAVPNEVVSQGQPLAVVADLSTIEVLAYIDENHVQNVSAGQAVDVFLDAYPGTRFDGTVQTVGHVAGDALSPLAGLSNTANTSRVTQRVPVNISVDFLGKYVVPGMNASIRIHR